MVTRSPLPDTICPEGVSAGFHCSTMMRPRWLLPWEEFVGTLRDVKTEDDRLLLVFEVTIAITFDNDLLAVAKRLVGREVAILRVDDTYRIRQVVRRCRTSI